MASCPECAKTRRGDTPSQVRWHAHLGLGLPRQRLGLRLGYSMPSSEAARPPTLPSRALLSSPSESTEPETAPARLQWRR
jgi:hypothetical protein